MSRLTGFLSGLLLVVALGVAAVRYLPPEFFGGNVTDEAADQVDGVAAENEPVPAADSTPAPLQSLPRVDDAPPAAADAALAKPGPGSAPGRSREPAATADPTPRRESASPEPAPDPAARQWHAFWQPFHSEISAEGFRRRLEGVTGLDYRVVSPRPGEYQVAFAYRDEAERLAHLAAIEAATGLVLRSKML